MSKTLKATLLSVSVAILGGVVVTLASVFWSGYLVQTGARFSIRLSPGENQIWLALSRGKYVYQVTTKPNLGLATMVGPEQTNVSIRSWIQRADEVIVGESGEKLHSFTISENSIHPLKLTVHVDPSNREPVYLSFRRAL